MPLDKMKRVVFPKEWSLQVYLEQSKREVEARLSQLPLLSSRHTPAGEAMRYALATPGKRFRALMVIATADIFEKGSDAVVMGAALAVESIHLASLILDDLPCMDDASLRRGQPTLHTRVGEADAILAAMALVAEAHHQLRGDLAQRRSEMKKLNRMSQVLTHAYSLDGLSGGQSDDLQDRPDLDLAALELIHAKKTGTLFTASVELACIWCGARAREQEQLVSYAKNLGLAFQIKDDLLDREDSKQTGKDSAKDTHKTTFVSLLGAKACHELYSELMEAALAQLKPLGDGARHIRELTHAIWHRLN